MISRQLASADLSFLRGNWRLIVLGPYGAGNELLVGILDAKIEGPQCRFELNAVMGSLSPPLVRTE